MVLGYSKKEKERRRNKFIPLAVAQHNARITNIQYSNPKITKPLFFIGAVLPDFKICWGVLGIYLIYKYPISLKLLLKNKIKDIVTTLKFKIAVRGYK